MMHVAGLFVMLGKYTIIALRAYSGKHHNILTFFLMMIVVCHAGIGADDIFLTIDTFDHTKVEYIEANDSNSKSHLRSYEEPDAIRERMITSYKIAGSMMLVSSLTTAICFFSNSFVSNTLISFEAKKVIEENQ